MRRGGRLGQWKVERILGRGGNGEVWRAANEQGREAALKVLRRTSREGVARFAREVAEQVALTQEGFTGILPVIDASPAGEAPPWLALPVAESAEEALGRAPSVEQVLSAVADIASVLSRLHERGLAHRDVKPQNLFRHDGQWCVGDLGLLQVPDAEPLTAGAKALGPRHFLAPEMLNDPAAADGRSADVYSLAKTLWVLLTGQSFPMPGPHRVEEDAVSLRAWIQHPWVNELDRLLQSATFFSAVDRPSMAAFESELRACLQPPPETADEPISRR